MNHPHPARLDPWRWTVNALAGLALATTAAAASAQPDAPALRELPADTLKQLYLDCDAAAMRRVLGFGEAAHCSMVYEALKEIAFGGDFDKLLAWSRAQPARQPPPTAAARPGRAS